MESKIPHGGEPSFSEITKQMRINADILMKEITDHALKCINKKTEWINVKENLPNCENKRYLIWVGYIGVAYWSESDWYSISNSGEIIYHFPTHWRELPVGPEE